MKLQYTDLNGTTHEVTAQVTTDHPASSYGQPVIVDENGNAMDSVSWVLLKFRVVEATECEAKMLDRVLAIDPDLNGSAG